MSHPIIGLCLLLILFTDCIGHYSVLQYCSIIIFLFWLALCIIHTTNGRHAEGGGKAQAKIFFFWVVLRSCGLEVHLRFNIHLRPQQLQNCFSLSKLGMLWNIKGTISHTCHYRHDGGGVLFSSWCTFFAKKMQNVGLFLPFRTKFGYFMLFLQA